MEEPQCPQCRDYITIIEALRNQIDEMRMCFESEIAKLKEEIVCLKAQLSKNSRNSSQPPSSDGLRKPEPKSLRKKSGRSPGGQRGHTGETLTMRDDPDEVVNHRVDQCGQCGHSLEGVAATDVERRQVVDIPPLECDVIEHRSEKKVCPCCGHVSTAVFPEGVTAPVHYGPRIRSIAIYLQQYQLLPFKRTSELLRDLFSVSMSAGTLVNIGDACSDRVDEATEHIRKMIRGAAVAHFDESGVSVNGKLHWLHVASTARATYYGIHAKRGSEAMNAIGSLPGFGGRAIHDFWKPYLGYPCEHGLCNAHLLRELVFLHEEQGQVWAKEMIDHLIRIKTAVDGIRRTADALPENQLNVLERRYWRIVKKGQDENPYLPDSDTQKKRGRPKKSKAQNLLDRLEMYAREILAFMVDFHVPFDNNLSERDIRMIKLRMKISGTFRSEQGGRIFCRIRSYISTARKNAVNVIQAIQDALAGHPFIPAPHPVPE